VKGCIAPASGWKGLRKPPAYRFYTLLAGGHGFLLWKHPLPRDPLTSEGTAGSLVGVRQLLLDDAPKTGREFHRRAPKQPRFVANSATAAPHPAFFLRQEQSKGEQMRYYFHLQSEDKIVPDEEGVHLEGEKNLPSAVHKALSELHDEQPELFERVSEWQLIVCNILDEVMFSMNLRDHRAADLLRLEAAA
jgi:hypothetical protein